MGTYMSDEEAIGLLSEHTDFSEEQKKVLMHKGGCCIVATAGSGKALTNGSKVLCYDEKLGSYFENIERLKVGQSVITIGSGVAKVVGVFPQGKKEEYCIKMNDGTEVFCCSEHLWSLMETNGTPKAFENTIIWGSVCNGKGKVVTTSDMIDMLNEHKEVELPVISNLITYNSTSTSERIIEIEDLYQDKHKIENGTIVFECETEKEVEELLDKLRSTGMIAMNLGLKVKCYNSMIGSTCIFGFKPNRIKKKVVSIYKTGREVEMTCIKVSDKSEMFITDNFNVTHNTTLLTNLITKRILTGELEPDKLVATTFSIDGANEMNSRLDVMFDRYGITWAKNYARIKTIHALCLQILRELNIPCNVVAGLSRYKMFMQALEMANVRLEKEDADELDSILGYQINKMMNDHDVVTSTRYTLDDIDEQTYTKIRQYYSLLKQQNGVIDYEDMLFQTYFQLCASGRQDIRQYFQNKWKYFYIDEAQDTSLIQYRILQALISDPNKVMMIGDDDQSIYSWRGASPEVLLNVCCDYNIKKLYLSTNYRCRENMVNFSASGILNNTLREKKNMMAYNKGGEIEFMSTQGELYEYSKMVAKEIERLHKEDNISFEDICVLARNNADLSVLSSILFNMGIYSDLPKEAKITSSKTFKDFKGIIDFVDGDTWFLDASLLPVNGWKLFLYFNKSTAKLLSNGMKSTGYDFMTMLEMILADKCEDAVGSGIKRTLKYETMVDMRKFLDTLHDTDTTKEEKAIKLIEYYTAHQMWRFKDSKSQRLIAAYLKLFRDMVQTYGLSDARKYIRNIELYEKGEIASIGSNVILSTCHRSKGREWKVVFILGDDNLSFPNMDAINIYLENGISKSDIYSWIEEERRLHYVAKTRAKDKLILAYNTDSISLFSRECAGEHYERQDILDIASGDKKLENISKEVLSRYGKVREFDSKSNTWI